MRYGLLADIHEDVDFLAAALDVFAREGTDLRVVLGDVFETGQHLLPTVSILREARAVGVWGNHDFGLCRNPHEDIRDRFGPTVMDFFASLRPTFESEDCLFTHVEPWRDAEDLVELWSFGSLEPPGRSFVDRPHRLMLHGHHHRWKVTTPDGPVPWDCFHPLTLAPDRRYLIEVGAVCDGRCGILDTTAGYLIPIDLRDGGPGDGTATRHGA